MKRTTIKVGTRGSALALAQTEQILRRLREIHPKLNFLVVPIKTSGDRITSTSALRTAGKGLFVKEIERALLARKISMAVHSLKDLPSELPAGLTLGAVPERADPRDVFIGRTLLPIDKLPAGSRIATSSLRRRAILKAAFPQLEFVDIKGNLDTRIAKLRGARSPLSGIVVAAAGIHRLYPDNGIPGQPLPTDLMVPAAGQGALALEIREADEEMKKILEPVHHPPTAACVEAERELQRRLEGGCQVPLGVFGEAGDDGVLRLSACLGTPDGRRIIRAAQAGMMDAPRSIAEALETTLVSAGAREILAELSPLRSSAPRKPRRRSPTRRGSRRR